MLKPVNAILWRKCNQATIDTLEGVSNGQYHIALQTHDYSRFFIGVEKKNNTGLGGYELDVPIEPFSGQNPVDALTLTFKYMGQTSARKDWNIPAQRPDTAYPLWRKGRGYSSRKTVGTHDYIVIARDTDGSFHARWVRSADFIAIPEKLRTLMLASDAGWSEVL
ncbi:hypothetical protein [Arenimonas sp.]|jgi:hypothetical protein|uniref:hypothetical protein n=1 Tax=Arenimonas sp. TaxID=1872635 RepID=UPI0037C134C0